MGDTVHVAAPHSRGLDGLRGLAIIGTLCYHLGAPWMRGGLFSVSLFFTLSGYLITQVLVREHAATGRVSLKQFWIRRARRLAPASLLALTLVGLCALATDWLRRVNLRGDLVASAFYAANWRFALSGQSYADAIAGAGGRSPVVHFWSLAIEEQFYVVFPVLMLLVLSLAHRARVGVLGGLALASAASAILSSNDMMTYYGTHNRAVELLAGAVLGLVLPLTTTLRRRGRVAVNAAGWVAAVVFLAALVAVKATSRLIYDGGLVAFSCVSAALVAAIGVGSGPLRRFCEWAPLTTVGAWSYGLYVFHWPVLGIVTPERTGWSMPVVTALRMLLTFGLAGASFTWLEHPIRRRRLLARRSTASVAFLVGCLLVVGVAVGVGASTPTEPVLAGLDAPSGPVQFSPAATPGAAVANGVQPPGVQPPGVQPPGVPAAGGPAALATSTAPDPLVVRMLRADRTVQQWLMSSTAHGRPIVVVPATAPAADLDVRVLGDEGRVTLRSAVRGLKGDALTLTTVKTSEAIADRAGVPAGSNRLLVIDTVPRADSITQSLRDVDLEQDEVAVVHLPTHDQARLQAELERVIEVQRDERLRVMVIGDSVSFGVASAIDQAASERISVLWAGGRNCPLIAVAEIRWWDGAQWTMEECPTLEGSWARSIADFRPDVVLAVASIPEQADQRYIGTDEWYHLGDPEFDYAHDVGFDLLQRALADTGTVTLLATSPPIIEGSLSGADFTRPERVAAWNEVLERWAQSNAAVELVDWSTIVLAAETLAGGSLRPDGVHMEQSVLDRVVADALVPAFDAALATVTADARSAGCLTGAGASRRLAPERCVSSAP